MEQELINKRAMRNYVDCTKFAAAQLDDGKSDALTIAKGIASMCHTEYRNFLATSSAAMNDRTRYYYYEEMNSPEQVTKIPLSSILLERAKSKQ